MIQDESTEELQTQLKDINAELATPHPQFKTNLWLRKLRIIMELSYRIKK